MTTLTIILGQVLDSQSAPAVADSLPTSFRERQSDIGSCRLTASEVIRVDRTLLARYRIMLCVLAVFSVNMTAQIQAQSTIVAYDQGHHNLGDVDGIFTEWLAEHGYELRRSDGLFTTESLESTDVVVIRNPLSRANVDRYELPTPSAFRPDEIASLQEYVRGGGGLVLIIEHMPWAGAMSTLAAAFGVEVSNGFVIPEGFVRKVVPIYVDSAAGALVFHRIDGSLTAHPVTVGVDSVLTHWGSAFRLPAAATSLLTLSADAVSLESAAIWTFPESTPIRSVGGWSQGALLQYGRGRVVILGDSFPMMAPGHVRLGTATEKASDNPTFFLHLLRWVSQH